MNPKIPPLYRGTSDAKPSATAQNLQQAAGTTATDTAASSPAPGLTVEGFHRRLRYFENLAEQHEAYIEVLKATIQRQGGAVPSAYFAPLTGAGGSHQPKSG